MNREEIYRQFEELDKRASLGGGVDKIVDDLGSLLGQLEGDLLDGLGGADHGEHTAVVVAVGLGVEQGAELTVADCAELTELHLNDNRLTSLSLSTSDHKRRLL